MNTVTIIVTVLTLWLVMGLGFLSAYVDARRNGKSKFEAWTSIEGILFVVSMAVPVFLGVFSLLS